MASEKVVHQQHENVSDQYSDNVDSEKHNVVYERTNVEDDKVTLKTWLVVLVLSASYGISFWPVPFFSTIQSQMAAEFGSKPAEGAWVTSVYSIGGTIAFGIIAPNTDLFGRRAFILFGNALMIIAAIVGGTSHHIGQTIAAHVMLGLAGGCCQMAAFCLPELLPNKWRHFAVVLADAVIYFDVIVGPVTARIAYKADAWRWGYWGLIIAQGISFVILIFFYFPPKHPRGVAWHDAIRHLDYVGMITFTGAAAMVLSGIVYVQLVGSHDPKTIGLLVAGFACLVFFALWETFAPLKNPLAPTRLFTANKGRALTAPFIVGFVVTMFYYANNITVPTMIAVYWTSATTPAHVTYLMATIQGFGIFTGAMILSFGGKYFKHWKWQLIVPVTIMTVFGALLAAVKPQNQSMGIAFAFLSSMGYGYAQYLSIAYIQFGAPQTELGIAGGLAGVARYAGGAVAVTLFLTILNVVQSSWAAVHVVDAAVAAGATRQVGEAVLAALPLGAAALEKVQGATLAIIEAAGGAFVLSYYEGVKIVALSSLGFGVVAIIACFFCEDIGPKMTPKIEVFLENDVQAEKNKYH